jgi:hypothetical protein
MALHAFVGQSVAVDPRWHDSLMAGFRCGFAVQQPIPLLSWNAQRGLFAYVQALSFGSPTLQFGSAPTWEIIPGVQWRMNDVCWMSLGLSHHNFLSCSWRY